jgi:hypothetical protein
MTVEQMIREVLEAVKQDKSLYEAYCKGTDPQTFSSGDLIGPANQLNACLRHNDKREVLGRYVIDLDTLEITKLGDHDR